MVVVLVEDGEVKQVWRDVETPAELKDKYGLQGAGYRAVPNAVVGQIEQNGGFENPSPAPHIPENKPDFKAAIQALISGDSAAAQNAIDNME